MEDLSPQVYGDLRRLDRLPDWPERTVAVVSTYSGAPRAVPVAALVRAGDRRVLFAVEREHIPASHLRQSPEIALTVLADRGAAFTARGRGQVLVDSLPGCTVVELQVEAIDNLGCLGYGVTVVWSDDRRLEVLRERTSALQWLAAPTVRRVV